MSRQRKDCDGKSDKCMDAKTNQDGSHIQAQAFEKGHDVAGLQNGLRDQRGDPHWSAVDHQVDLLHTRGYLEVFLRVFDLPAGRQIIGPDKRQ